MSKIQVDSIVNKDDTGSPTFPRGATVTGVITATSFTGDVNGDAQGLSGTPNIVVGVTTASTVNASSSITVGDTFVQSNAVGLGTTTTAGRNAGVGTATGTLIYNAQTSKVEVYDGTQWVAGLASPTGQIEATGGTIVTDATHRTHIFTGVDAFSVSSCPPTATIEYLVVGGGGSGFGNGNTGGAGGAGGLRTGSGYPVSATNYVASVAGAGALGAPGSNSELLLSGTGLIVGSGGGTRSIDNGDGGSGAGGGANGNQTGGSAVVSPDGISPTAQGNAGGNGGGSTGRGAGGGGGAGGAGNNGTPSVGGAGGVGTPISWVPTDYGTPGPNPGRYFGGGGGGGKDGPGGTGGAGGAGGGGKGQDATTDNATAGDVNTGGGGGGGGGQTGVLSGTAKAGGSGFIAIRYPYSS